MSDIKEALIAASASYPKPNEVFQYGTAGVSWIYAKTSIKPKIELLLTDRADWLSFV